MKLIAVVTLLVYSFTTSAQGLLDGYNKGKGNLDIATSAFFQTSDIFIGGNGNEFNISRDILSIGAFGAFGITDRWDVIANIPLINGQLQDFGVGTKYKLLNTKIGGKSLSVFPAVTFSFPLSNYETQSTQAVGQRATVLSPRIIIQQNLPAGLFLQIQGGYNYALTPVVSSIPLSTKIGGAYGKFYFDVWYDYQKAEGGIDYPTSDSFRTLGVDHQRFGGVFYYQIKKKYGLFANYSYTYAGRNTGKALGFGAGAVFKFDTTSE